MKEQDITTHHFKKKFGQNFITDTNLLEAIVRDSEVKKSDVVLEIGAGAGTLTKVIAKEAKRVVSYEIDKDLVDRLNALNLDNVKFVFEDALKQEMTRIESTLGNDNYKLIANLPYYITTPLIFKFLEDSTKIQSLTIMVQKEVAERIVAKEGNKDYGILSVMIDFYGSAKITRNVSRKLFFPQPNVDSAVVKIEINKDKYHIDRQKFSILVKSAFAMRRKTILNNLSTALKIEKNKLTQILKGFDLSRRAESFSVEEFVNMTKALIMNGEI